MAKKKKDIAKEQKTITMKNYKGQGMCNRFD